MDIFLKAQTQYVFVMKVIQHQKNRDIQMGFLINVMRKLVQVKMLKILFMNIQKRMLMLFMKKEKCQLNLLFFIFV